MHRTPKHQLADLLLGVPLLDWIDERRPSTSWMQISLQLRDATSGAVTVTPETLRAWYADDQAAKTGAA